MDRGLFIAASSASAMMDRQATIANNLANSATPGFKKLMDQNVSWAPQQEATHQSRAYAPLVTPGVDVRPGAIAKTDNPLHVALPENVYLALDTPAGERFTRRGDIQLDAQGQLRLATGDAVAGENGPLVIPAGFSANIASDGTVFAFDPANAANREEIGRLRMVSAPKEAVSMGEDARLTLAAELIQPVGENARVQVGALEQSNASPSEMMAKMMESSRLYEMNVKMISAFNSAEQKGSTIVGNWR